MPTNQQAGAFHALAHAVVLAVLPVINAHLIMLTWAESRFTGLVTISFSFL